MSAFFGIEESNAVNYIEWGKFCIPNHPSGEQDTHGVVSPIRNQDVVFIKHCETTSDFHIKAVGIVRSDYAVETNHLSCLPVEWVWHGDKVPINVDEVEPLSSAQFYEEHNILVQREIENLLPEKYRLSQTW
jgi:hypothetical protein